MSNSLYFIYLMCLCTGLGLDLTLDLSRPLYPGVRPACGVVTCVENYTSSNSSLSSNTSNSEFSDKVISAMSLFKKADPEGENKKNNDRGYLLASLTLQQPNISRISDGIKIDGRLEANNGHLRLELVKQTDCLSDFTCEVRSVDIQGNELVNSNRLRQQKEQSGGQSGDGARMSLLPQLQLLTFVQQIDTKLSLLGTSLGDKLGSLENRLEDKIRLVEEKINSVENGKEDKFALLQSIIESLHDNFENTVRNNMLDGKVGDNCLEMKKTNTSVDDNKRDVMDVLLSSQEQMGESLSLLQSYVWETSEARNYRFNETKQTLSLLESQLTQLLVSAEKNQRYLNDVTEMLLKIPESNQNLSQQVGGLKSNTQESSRGVLSAVNRMVTRTNSALVNDIQSAVNLLQPRSCRKGMAYVAAQPPFPHPVVYPGEVIGLDVPYLCDTATEGGGWIVIQRRSTGNVDFFRDWATYKKGFGSLADDFWLGNENIHTLTSTGTYELRVDMIHQGKSFFAHYETFSISNETNFYTLQVGKHDGTAGDSLEYHDGNAFSTFDKDNDISNSSTSCANTFKGAWWYKKCYQSNLNGVFQEQSSRGPTWNSLKRGVPVTFSEMKLRLVDSL